MELAEAVGLKFGQAAIKDGVEVFAKRIATVAARHGEEAVFAAVRRSGPEALYAIERAGAGRRVGLAHLPPRRGGGSSMSHGDRRRCSCLRNMVECRGGVVQAQGHRRAIDREARPTGGGSTGAGWAAKWPSPGNHGSDRRPGEDRKDRRLLSVIGKYGEKAADFVWNHKGALAVSGTLVAFLSDPEPFINGTVKLAEPIAEIPGKLVNNVVAPVVQAPVNAVATVAEDAGSAPIGPLCWAWSPAAAWRFSH